MRQVRWKVMALSGWLILCIIADSLLPAVNFSPFLYILIALMLVSALALGPVPKWARILILVLPILLLLATELITRQIDSSADVPLFVTEAFILAVTGILASRVALALSEFESALIHISVGQPSQSPKPADEGMGILYREVRRARNHQRPLSLLAVTMEGMTSKVKLEKIVRDAQAALIRQYVHSAVSATLCEKLEDCDIVVQAGDHFLILLPETKPGDVPGLIERLRKQVDERVGVGLRVGIASLPADGFTLEGLMERATEEMQAGQKAETKIELEQLSANNTR